MYANIPPPDTIPFSTPQLQPHSTMLSEVNLWSKETLLISTWSHVALVIQVLLHIFLLWLDAKRKQVRQRRLTIWVNGHHGRESIAAGTGDGWSHCDHNREAETRQEVGLDYRNSRPFPSDSFPPQRLYFLKGPQPSNRSPSALVQVFKCVSLWRLFTFKA